MLPEEIIGKISEGLTNYNGTGKSVIEIGKNQKEYAELVSSTEELLRELMDIPQGYEVLFMAGGSDVQYSAVPLNALSDHKCADYIISGRLSKNASLEAKKHGDIAIAASSAGASPAFSTVPETERKHFRPDADYVYICYNNTVYGTKFHYIPDTGNIPLISDMSSFMLSEPVDVSKFALIFANAECGIGVPGLTVVILRDDLTAGACRTAPGLLDYKAVADMTSDLSPAPAFSVYVAKLVLEWIK